jgi:hypothetical protein
MRTLFIALYLAACDEPASPDEWDGVVRFHSTVLIQSGGEIVLEGQTYQNSVDYDAEFSSQDELFAWDGIVAAVTPDGASTRDVLVISSCRNANVEDLRDEELEIRVLDGDPEDPELTARRGECRLGDGTTVDFPE